MNPTGQKQLVGTGINNPERDRAAELQLRGVEMRSVPVLDRSGQVPLSQQNQPRDLYGRVRQGVPLSQQNGTNQQQNLLRDGRRY